MSKTMENEVLCAAKFLPCELLDARPSALDYAIQDIAHQLTDSVMCELEKGELICSLQDVEQHQLHDLNVVKIIRKVTLKRLVRCGKCNRRYKPLDDDARNEIYCEFIGSTMRKDDFCSYGCADGERRDEQ